MENLLGEILKLSETDLHKLIFMLLLKGQLKFVDLSGLYVQALEVEAKSDDKLIGNLAFSLSAYRDGSVALKAQMIEPSRNALLESCVFKNSDYEKKLLEEK